MNCPNCKEKMVVTDYKGVKIDKCPNCKSVFLDGGELEKIEKKFDSEKHSAVSSAESSSYGDGFLMGGLLFQCHGRKQRKQSVDYSCDGRSRCNSLPAGIYRKHCLNPKNQYKMNKEEAKIKLAEVEKEANKLREIINTKDDITDKIKTFNDACIAVGTSEKEFDKSTRTLSSDTIAYEKLKIIARALNEGWTPDWKDNKEYKHWPFFTLFVGGHAYTGSHAGLVYVYSSYKPASTYANFGSRLCFKSRDLAKYAGEQFIDIYEKFIKK